MYMLMTAYSYGTGTPYSTEQFW